MFTTLALIASVSLATPLPDDPPIVTTGALLSQMSDLEFLTRHPAPGTRVVQFSSYDRRSSVPGGPHWFANSDGFGGEPIPNFEGVVRPPRPDGVGEYLICDIQQPGAIVRTWTAAIRGTIRVTLDGSDTPVYDGPATDFLMHRASRFAQAAGVTLDPAVTPAFEQRYADYFPVPFARSCRIVWTGNAKEVHFYQVQACLYPPGTPVRTFASSDMRDFSAEATATADKMLSPHAPTATDHADATINADEMLKVLELNDGGAISSLSIKVEADDVAAALRGTVMRISFDGAQRPQIAVPIGDFFGAAPGIVPYQSLPMSVQPDGTMSCRFVMPFRETARISFENRTDKPLKVNVAAARTPYAWDDRSMYFRTTWRADHDLFARGGDNVVDLPFLLAHAPHGGLYVGTAAYLMNPCPVPTAGGNWWGEGDEKIFVDAEPRPSIFGTGSEDYFNYAWSESDIFQYPYFAQPICTGPDTRGYVTNNRWHVIDAIPFDHSISFYMELFAHTPTPHLSYARAAYWYAGPGASDDAPPLNDAALRVPALPAWRVEAKGGASGATMIEAEDALDASSPSQIVTDPKYSAGRLVRLKGPTASLRVNTPTAGKYRVVLTCASGPVKSSFAADLDATRLKRGEQDVVELQTEAFERLVNIWCEPVDLTAGEHVLKLTQITGADGVGVDFVWLKPVK
jgi:hypothetical protein